MFVDSVYAIPKFRKQFVHFFILGHLDMIKDIRAFAQGSQLLPYMLQLTNTSWLHAHMHRPPDRIVRLSFLSPWHGNPFLYHYVQRHLWYVKIGCQFFVMTDHIVRVPSPPPSNRQKTLSSKRMHLIGGIMQGLPHHQAVHTSLMGILTEPPLTALYLYLLLI